MKRMILTVALFYTLFCKPSLGLLYSLLVLKYISYYWSNKHKVYKLLTGKFGNSTQQSYIICKAMGLFKSLRPPECIW